MYNKFYGFKKMPFQVAADADFLFKSDKHLHALSYLEYGLNEFSGLMVLSGDVGSGKTTTVQYLLKQLDSNFSTALISNTNVTAKQLLSTILQNYGIEPENKDKADILNTLNQFLIAQTKGGHRVLLVVDEAQNLSIQVLEEVRMLLNLQWSGNPLLQIMLVGQPELLHTLKKEEMKQFAQRVAVNYHLTALDKEETGKYISHRLGVAGGSKNLFTLGAAEKIHELSGGIPRLINLVCQAALVYGYADEAKKISQDIIKQITEDNIVIGLESGETAKKVNEDVAISKVVDTEVEDKMVAIEESMVAINEDINKIVNIEIYEIKKELKELKSHLQEKDPDGQSQQIEWLKIRLQQEKNRYAKLSCDYDILKQNYQALEKETQSTFLNRKKKLK